MRTSPLCLVVAFGCGARPAASPPPANTAPADLCAALTAADLADVCGTDDETLTADDGEGRGAAPTCSRWLGTSSTYSRFRWQLWRVDPAEATERFERGRAGPVVESKDVALGDRARIDNDHTAMESAEISLVVVRGGDLLDLSMHQRDFDRAACTEAQLVELGRRVLERLR